MGLEKELFDKWLYDFLKEFEDKCGIFVRIRELADDDRIGKKSLLDYLSVKFFKTETSIAKIESYFKEQIIGNKYDYLYIYSTSYDDYNKGYLIVYAFK